MTLYFRLHILICLIILKQYVNPECGEIYEQGVSSCNIKDILWRLNDIRMDVMKGNVPGQPRGVNLQILKWDDGLGKTAQDIANNCDPSIRIKVNDERWSAVGKTDFSIILFKYQAGADWMKAINNWYEHHVSYMYGRNTQPSDYAQLVWDTTEYVGCGYTFFKISNLRLSMKFYICVYGPAGNIYNNYPYKLADISAQK